MRRAIGCGSLCAEKYLVFFCRSLHFKWRARKKRKKMEEKCVCNLEIGFFTLARSKK